MVGGLECCWPLPADHKRAPACTPFAVCARAAQFNCLAEVPAFHFQGRIARALSTDAVLHLASGVLVLRLLCYAALPLLPGAPWSVLAVELSHGCTFAMAWGVAVSACKHIAPEGLAATMQVRALV